MYNGHALVTSLGVSDLAKGSVSTFVVVATCDTGAGGAESKPLIAGIPRDPNSGITLTAVPAVSNSSGSSTSALLSWNACTPSASDAVTSYKVLVNGKVAAVAKLPPSGIPMNSWNVRSLPPGAVVEVAAVFASGATLSSTPVPISSSAGSASNGMPGAGAARTPPLIHTYTL
eukprot:tig00000654_g2823.t1